MNQTVAYITEMTVVAIVIGWVISKNTEFGQVVNAGTAAVIGSVRALQGRP